MARAVNPYIALWAMTMCTILTETDKLSNESNLERRPPNDGPDACF
jgi:hypothetical protein